MGDKNADSEHSVESLTRLLRQYEEISVQLKAELQVQSNGKDLLNSKISELKKENLHQIQEITRLKDAAKFDKIAAEGLVRKNGILAHDLAGSREENKNIKEERNLYQTRVAHLEQKLNVDRSMRLQLLHENELLQQKLNHISSMKSDTESQYAKTQSELFVKSETLESVNAFKEAQTDFITKQFEDIMKYSLESVDLKQDKFRLAESVRIKDRLIAEYAAKIGRLEEEGRQLRKEVFQLRQLSESKQSRRLSPIPKHKCETSSPNRSSKISTVSGSLSGSAHLSISSPSSMMSKSLYLGSGLGLRKDNSQRYQSSGSAKSIL